MAAAQTIDTDLKMEPLAGPAVEHFFVLTE
jgi:hypothetical protein